ncbi:MAG: 30S ribosomal protein S7, partial [Bacteroidota bacterium]
MRKKRAEKRRTMPDPRFNDVLVAKFVNNIMIQGKKNVARQIVYQALDIVGKKT